MPRPGEDLPVTASGSWLPLPSQSDPLVSEANLNIHFMFARSQARAQNTGTGPAVVGLEQPNRYRTL